MARGDRHTLSVFRRQRTTCATFNLNFLNRRCVTDTILSLPPWKLLKQMKWETRCVRALEEGSTTMATTWTFLSFERHVTTVELLGVVEASDIIIISGQPVYGREPKIRPDRRACRPWRELYLREHELSLGMALSLPWPGWGRAVSLLPEARQHSCGRGRERPPEKTEK